MRVERVERVGEDQRHGITSSRIGRTVRWTVPCPAIELRSTPIEPTPLGPIVDFARQNITTDLSVLSSHQTRPECCTRPQ